MPPSRSHNNQIANHQDLDFGGIVGASATANSEEGSLYLQAQKKSLEVITERQSEFSNTMGTFARPSQRSKLSKNQSSNTKQNTNPNLTIGGVAAAVNGSAASLNNSSLHINSSRIGPNQSVKK